MSAIFAGSKQTVNAAYSTTTSDAVVGNVAGCLGAIAIAVKITHLSGSAASTLTPSCTNRDTAGSEGNNGVGQTFTSDPTTGITGANAPAMFVLYPAGGMPVVWPSVILYLKAATAAEVVKIEAWPIFTDPTRQRGSVTTLQQLSLPA